MASPGLSVPTDSITFNNKEAVQMQVGIQNVYGPIHQATLGPGRKRRYSQIDAESTEHDDAIINSLSFPQMLDRRSNIRQPHPDTCEWVWEHVEFVQWLGLSKGLLWITGKAGAGKSTLMSYLYEKFCRKRDKVTGIYLDFFFSSRGVELQKCPLGMLRSLLCQLFMRDENVRRKVRTYYQERHICSTFGDCGQVWQQFELEKLLRDAILEAAQIQQVTIFVDALDEAGDTFARGVSAYLHSINDQSVSLDRPVKICASSRPYPNVARILALQVYVDQCNADAISLFVNDSLDLGPLIRDDDPDLEKWRSIKSTIIRQANGLFQWARLVVSLVESKISDGEPPGAIHQWLSKTPAELDAVYTHIVSQILMRNHGKQSLRLFQWVLFAQYPMSLSDVRYALIAHEASTEYYGRYEDLQDFIESDENLIRLIKTWAGGLIELKESQQWQTWDHTLITGGRRILQVAHKSVKDFLFTKGLDTLSSASEMSTRHLHLDQLTTLNCEPAPSACETLYRTCLMYIDHELSLYQIWTHPLQVLKQRSPFILHASSALLYYAQNAQQRGINNIEAEVRVFQRIYTVWISIVKQLRDTHNDLNRYIYETSNPSLFKIACVANLHHIVTHLQSQPDWKNTLDRRGRSALHLAAMYGAIDSASILHKAGLDLWLMDKDGDTPLSLAAAYHRLDFCAWILKTSAISDAQPLALQIALCPAAGAGNLQLVQLLLQNGTDINMCGRNRYGQTASALHFAAAEGHETVVRYLLQNGAAADQKKLDLGYVMDSLCFHKGKHHIARRILRLLLDAGAYVNSYDEYCCPITERPALNSKSPYNCSLYLKLKGRSTWQTALTTAIEMKDAEAIQLLLRYGANPNIGPLGSQQYREQKILENTLDIIRLLIKAGAEFDDSDGSWRSNLVTAAASGHTELVEIFLKARADPEVRRSVCDTALLGIARSGSVQIAAFLLEKGATINCRNFLTQDTPLFVAVQGGNFTMAEFLLSRGADIFARDWKENTLLHAAAIRPASTNLISWLIKLGVPLETQNVWRWTPLHLAIRYELVENAGTLLKHGASPNTRDMYGKSPFDHAKSRGEHDLMRIMKNSKYGVEDNSHYSRRLALQRSIGMLAANLLDYKFMGSLDPGFNELGFCLLYLEEYDDAEQCLQSAFCYIEGKFWNVTECEICDQERQSEHRHICTACCKDVCDYCLFFLKSKESTFEECHEHNFLTVSAPSLSDFLLDDEEFATLHPEHVLSAIVDKNQELLSDLANRFSRFERHPSVQE